MHVADGHETAMVILRDLDPSLTLIDLPLGERDLLLHAARALDPEARIVIAEEVSGDELLRCIHEARRRDEDRPPAA